MSPLRLSPMQRQVSYKKRGEGTGKQGGGGEKKMTLPVQSLKTTRTNIKASVSEESKPKFINGRRIEVSWVHLAG